MLSPEFVNAKTLRERIGELNRSGALGDTKVQSVGVKKDALVDSFLKAVESVPENSEEEKLLPEDVVNFYNEIVSGEDPSPEEIAKMKEAKKSKTRKPSGPSNEQLAYDMVKAGKSKEEIAKAFTERYHERGQTDAAFIGKRIEIYIRIAKKRLEKETGKAAEEEAAE